MLDLDQYSAEFLLDLQKIRLHTSENIRQAQALVKKYYEKRIKAVSNSFSVGKRILADREG